MKEWFKARNVWGATILSLSDAEAGRIAKAIWAYTMNGEILPLEGAEKGIFPMILMTLTQDEERENEISEKRSLAGKSGAMTTNAGKSHQMPANDSKCRQMPSNADIKNQNKNQNIDKEQESESEYIADTEAREIQNDHDRVLNAAEDAGFMMSNNVRASLIALYAENGLVKVLDGLKSCSDHGVANLAYLKACMKGEPKKPKVIAQDFAQRDYTSVNDELMDSTAREVSEFLKKGVG